MPFTTIFSAELLKFLPPHPGRHFASMWPTDPLFLQKSGHYSLVTLLMQLITTFCSEQWKKQSILRDSFNGGDSWVAMCPVANPKNEKPAPCWNLNTRKCLSCLRSGLNISHSAWQSWSLDSFSPPLVGWICLYLSVCLLCLSFAWLDSHFGSNTLILAASH